MLWLLDYKNASLPKCLSAYGNCWTITILGNKLWHFIKCCALRFCIHHSCLCQILLLFFLHPYIFIFENILREGVKRKINHFCKIFRKRGGGYHTMLWNISMWHFDRNRSFQNQMDTKLFNLILKVIKVAPKNVSKICVLYLNDFLRKNWEIYR